MLDSLLCSTNGNATVIRDRLRETYPSQHWYVLTIKGTASWRYHDGELHDKTDCGFYEVVWRGHKQPNANCNKYSNVQYIIDLWVEYGGTPDEIRLNIIKGIKAKTFFIHFYIYDPRSPEQGCGL